MKQRKPDRWEREVANIRLDHIASPYATQIPDEAWPAIEYRIYRALLKQHRWVQRVIKRLPLYAATATEFKEGYTRACNDILAKLKERSK